MTPEQHRDHLRRVEAQKREIAEERRIKENEQKVDATVPA